MLTKVNDRLYEQASGTRPLKWAKRLEPIRFKLLDVHVKTVGGVVSYQPDQEYDDPKLETIHRLQICARAVVDNGHFEIINEQDAKPHHELSLTIEGEPRYDEVDTRNFGPGEGNGKYIFRHGDLIHMPEIPRGYEDGCFEADLSLNLRAPELIIQALARSLQENTLVDRVFLWTKIESFRSEVDRALEEVGHYQVFSVESRGHSHAYFSNLIWLSPARLPLASESSEETIWAPPRADQSENFALIELAKTLKGVKRVLIFIAIVLVLGLLASYHSY